MKGKKLTDIILLLSLAIFLFGSGFKLGEYLQLQKISNVNYSATSGNFNFSLFWETWNKLQQKFIDKKKLDTQKMYYGAIKGMVSAVDDPYTFFLTPDENKQAKEDLQGKFQGIGAQLGLKDNRIIVIAPLKKSPAEKAGVLSGDFINKVDDQSTKSWTLPQAVSKIRGPAGTKVKLTLERNGKEFDVTIMRAEINVSSVELTSEKQISCQNNCPQVAYLKLNQFGENTNDEWDRAVAQISSDWKNHKIKGMVLDLRDNPGGFLDSAVYLASDFLPVGKIVVKQESTSLENKDYLVARTGRLLDIPLTVLINKGSASASEILGGSLRDYKRATLIGEKTFGKGSVQEAVDLSGGAGLHVTVAKWILPNGDWINGKGIEPGINVENKPKEGTTLSRDQDLQLEKAIEVVLK